MRSLGETSRLLERGGAAQRLGAMEHVGTVVNVAWKWKGAAARDGAGRPAGLTAGQGSGAACHCQDDVSACACPAPGFLKWYPGFLSSLVFFFILVCYLLY